jgi:hypothetical protein
MFFYCIGNEYNSISQVFIVGLDQPCFKLAQSTDSVFRRNVALDS